MNIVEKAGVQSGKKSESIPVLVITAPTATGKTALLESLFASNAKSHFAGKAEIISADSMQVYKMLDIGTAKPDKSFCERLPHHLIDICTPDHQFGAGEFVYAADELCHKIWEQGKMPVVCGGTTFYIKNFLYGLPPTPECNAAVRDELDRRIKAEGAEVLWNELNALDPESAAKIHVNDEYRIKRALEVCLSTGKKRSDFEVPSKLRDGFRFCVIKLERPREILYERINSRVDEMFSLGLADEFERVRACGYKKEAPGLQAIGYREFFMVEESGDRAKYLEEVRELIKKDTRHYAKKQQTFFRSLPDGRAFSADDTAGIEQYISDFLSEYNNYLT